MPTRRPTAPAAPACAHTPMTARPQNSLLKSLLDQEASSVGAATLRSPSTAAAKSCRDNGAWYIVATDGSTSIITSKSAGMPQSAGTDGLISDAAVGGHGRVSGRGVDRRVAPAGPSRQTDSTSDAGAANQKSSDSQSRADACEPGVDLSYLNVERETASKLIAGMNAMTQHPVTAHSKGEIEMPSAMTDLREMFRTDDVCMVDAQKVL